ncbi:serine/threonine-protein kinase [Polyangium aurulentum]|uniref:serine/threonine-protein kinase n=1 Tax=Polyangium aurulentum TaxID=2567896 RepID=UPI001F1A3D8A|nr:serine/threonine-protein kinase [Polyangium aurulentum]UQA60893.1 protein kinase [Polyangium aurulentum]
MSEAGRVLSNRYRLVRPVGQGSQGSVWIADHLALNTPVAVKLIDPELAKRDDARERFKREATAAAQLRSAHVVQILDHGIDQGQPFIVMELLEGEDLFDRLNARGRLSLRETSKVITQVARALARAHAAGITHRDLKPENVFLCHNEDDEVVKVLDFGVAKVKDPAKATMARTGVGTLIGTPHYMSPEQVKGIQEVDHRTDLWALGVMTYQCVVGELPFDSEGVGDLLIKISIAEPPVPSKVYAGLPAAFDAWFARACARDPDKRFQSARELAEALARVVASVPEAMRGELPPRPASIRPPPAAPQSAKTPPPRPVAKAPAPAAPPRATAKPAAVAAATPTPAPAQSEVLDASDFIDVSESSGRPPMLSSGEDVDFDFDFDFDNEPPIVTTGFPPEVQPAAQPPSTRTAIPAAAKSAPGPQPPPARATPRPAQVPAAAATPLPSPQRITPPPGSAPHAIPPPPSPAAYDRVSDLGAPVMPPGLLNEPPRAPRTSPTTAPGGVLSIPPPPELDGSRRRRTLAFVGVAFFLLAGGVAWMVVQSNMGGTNASSPVPPPPTVEAPEPPPVLALPSPTASFGATTTPTKPVAKGTRPAGGTGRTTTKTKGGTTKKTPGDDTTIEIPTPAGDEGAQQEPPAHVEPQSPEPAPHNDSNDAVPPAP